jgi:hypothetical protein
MKDLDSSLQEAKLYVESLRSSLVKRTDPAQVSTIAKIPYKALEIREALLYRATDLADAACMLFEKENLVSAACVSRALQETVAVLFCVNRRVKETIKNKDIDRLDDDLMIILMGTKNNPELPDPKNILSMIDRVDKEIPSFRALYDNLSEFAHPNWAGTLGIYSKINKEKVWTDFGRNIKGGDAVRYQAIPVLYASLKLIVHIYDEFVEFLPQLATICEEHIRKKNAT